MTPSPVTPGRLTSSPGDEEALLIAARNGDEDAYGQLVSAHRTELHAHCYRMLGSVADAEDALQDAFFGAWRGLGRFEGRSSVRTWLYRVTTNACIKAIERRPHRVLPMDLSAAADPYAELSPTGREPVWLEPYPEERLAAIGDLTPEARFEQRESIELAFVAALQHLPARQRAVLVLRDVLGYSAAETAGTLATTTTSVNSLLQRAHKTVSQRLAGPSQQATLRSLGADATAEIAERYVAAWERSDVEAMVKMLSEDAIYSMPPLPQWFQGVAAISVFLASRPMARGYSWRALPTGANGQLAFGHYLKHGEATAYLAHSVAVLTLRGPRIAAVTSFRNAAVLADFGLPAQLPA